MALVAARMAHAFLVWRMRHAFFSGLRSNSAHSGAKTGLGGSIWILVRDADYDMTPACRCVLPVPHAYRRSDICPLTL